METKGSVMSRAASCAFLTSLLLSACGVHHGPVSGGTMRQLREQAVTETEARRMLRGGHIDTRSTPGATRVSVPMHRDSAGLPNIDVSFSGRRPTRLLLDTGATLSVLAAAMATKLDVATIPNASPQMQGVIGREAGMGAIIESLQIGTWRLENLPCVVRLQRSSGGIEFLGANFDISLLGFHLVQKHCSYVTFDYPRRVIEFGFGGRFEGPKSRQHFKAPFVLKHGVPMVRLTVGKTSWEAILDTGSAFGVEIDQKLATRLGHEKDGLKVDGPFVMVGVGGAVSPRDAGVRIITVNGLRMLGREFPKAQLDVMPGPARIGSFFLQKHRVTFDLRRSVAWLEQ